MENYIAARPDVFFTGPDGSLRSNRTFCQLAGQYAVDIFVGSTLQMDREGNSSTVTSGSLLVLVERQIWVMTREASPFYSCMDEYGKQ